MSDKVSVILGTIVDDNAVVTSEPKLTKNDRWRQTISFTSPNGLKLNASAFCNPSAADKKKFMRKKGYKGAYDIRKEEYNGEVRYFAVLSGIVSDNRAVENDGF